MTSERALAVGTSEGEGREAAGAGEVWKGEGMSHLSHATTSPGMMIG